MGEKNEAFEGKNVKLTANVTTTMNVFLYKNQFAVLWPRIKRKIKLKESKKMYSKGDLCADEMKVSPAGIKEENAENERTRKESSKNLNN